MKKLLGLLLFLPLSIWAQFPDDDLQFIDHVYVENIKSVKLNVANLPLSMPIINLNSRVPLMLSFDDLDGEVKNYIYTVQHCDINWEPSNLTDTEYLDGFMDNDIDQYSFSFQTNQDFVHYEVLLPNDDFKWTKSGNYLLKVYEDEDEQRLVITRRFVVVDPKVSVNAKVVVPALVSKSKTHQEIDFAVDYEKFPMRSPQQELKAAVLQNGRWDNAYTDLSPNFTRLGSVVFDYQNKIVFPAGKEFRFADIRSFRFGTPSIAIVEEVNGTYEVALNVEEKRSNVHYVSWEDFGGNFVIETRDQRNNDLSSDYGNIFFSLAVTAPLYDEEVYIFGALTDWQLKEEFKMIYNPAVNAYVGKTYLKQGVYDFMYVTVPRDPKLRKKALPNLEEIEGNWFETANNYTILIYYKPFGERYYQVISSNTFSSVDR
ncbi:MAG: DUF5103 domain-containing protein [Saprospiraceae bacterium]|nr:DUF5103 domain-containing protein [Saprospiraceae bacterium]